MPKKLSIITLLLLYLVTASGFALNLHYCFGIITSVKLNEPPKTCGPEKLICCHNKHIDIKVKDAHQAQTNLFLAKFFNLHLPKLCIEYSFLPSQQIAVNKPVYRGPPYGRYNLPVYLKNCNFRI